MAKGWPGVVDRNIDTSLLGNHLGNGTEKKLRPYAFMCSKPNCYYAVSAKSLDRAQEIEREHPCPYISGITHIGSSVTSTILEQCWEDADTVYAKMTDDETLTQQQRAALASQLNGMCRMIARFMPPIMHTATEVGNEIRKRYNMKQAGEHYETPGLGGRRYETVSEPKRQVATVAQRAQKVLTEQERKAIKFAADSGMFTKAELAKTYEVTEAVIQEVSS